MKDHDVYNLPSPKKYICARKGIKGNVANAIHG